MARWRAFVDVLDGLLADRRESVEEVAARMTATQPIYRAAIPALPNRFWSRPGPFREPAASPRRDARQTATQQIPPQVRGYVQTPPRNSTERRAPRRLKPAEVNALQTLVRLGAALDVGFTTRELRTAFRSLAQRYHPDRHPGANDAERMRLGAAFAELTSAYGVLNDTAQ